MSALQDRDRIMAKPFAAAFLFLLAGCAFPPPQDVSLASPCAAGEATHACQVKRYHDVASP